MLEIDPDQALAYGLFSRRQARAAGCSPVEIARRLRTGRWRSVEFGIYAETGRVARIGDSAVTALLRAGPSSVASHFTAADALGWDLLKLPGLQFTVPTTHGTTKSNGAAIFRRKLTDDEVATVDALRVTTPLRTAIDVARDGPLLDAVVAIDSALRLQQVTLPGLWRALADRRNMPRTPRVRGVFALLDPGAGSVPESVARVLFTDAGLPAPESQFEVRAEDGSFIGRADFAWPSVWLIVEIDGFAWHSSQAALQSDHERQNELELAGYTVLRFTAKDVHERPEKVTETVRRALLQRGLLNV